MRQSDYPPRFIDSNKKGESVKINLAKKLASESGLTGCNAREPVKFFPLYDRNLFHGISRRFLGI
jgi:hypothetical protein